MELVDGESLEQVVAGRRLRWEEAKRATAPIAAALAYAHGRGVVHRDLTPSNVLVERASGRVVVSDFGLARLARSDRATPVSSVLAGTPEYWSPEQAAGRPSDAATDMYALGCLLYRLVAGRVPFDGEDRLAAGLRRIHEDAPPLDRRAAAEARTLVAELLSRDPSDRPTAAEVARRLGGRAAPAARAAPPPQPPGDAPTLLAATLARPAPHRARRRRTRAIALATAVVAALAVGGVYAVASLDPPGIAAPAVVGDALTEARTEVAAAADEANVDAPIVQVVGRSYSEDVPAGAVLMQDPAPGSHVPETDALRVRLSLGSAWADVPDIVGTPTRDALRTLADAGFTPVRRYGPSHDVAAWHVSDTSPGAGSRLRRPAKVTVVVSTGAPRASVPDVGGWDADDAVDALEDVGFATSVEETASAEDAGTVLSVSPAAGTRLQMGSTVTVVVAREPRWETVRAFEGEEDASTEPISVPAGARVVLVAHNTSFLGVLDGWVGADWSGDDDGSAEVDSGREAVIVEPADDERTIAFRLEPHGSVRWELAVEAAG
jgi:serine/threonine-protein kinase